ncbi:Cytochrome b5 [Pseudolycoriella hygida]|uniref:Cytochrome b5 n=1 Tax=Pseudolycoriella hygida TaxID=35572 RepID=A0A9Q0N5E2_9DIPT|nr:Cytochrome b5 [Pseudolycoriella hygida]
MPEKTEIQLFKLSDVAVNDGKDGKPCWIIVKDSVYNVTNYLDDHPGGGELITEFAGRDATKGFEDFGHSGDAKKLLKQLKIGEIVEEDRKSKRNNGKANQNVYANAANKKKSFKFFFCV